MLCFQLYTYLRFTPTWGDNVWITFDFFFPFLLSLHHNQHYSTKDKAFQEHVFLEVHNLLKTNTHYLSSSLQERDSHTPTCWLAQCWCLMSTLSILTETAVSGPIPSLFFWISKPAHKNPCLLHRQDCLTVWIPIMSKGQKHHSQFFFFFRETLYMLVQGHWLAWIFFFFISGGDEHQPDLPRKAYAAEHIVLSPWHLVHKKKQTRKGTRPWSSFSITYILIWLRNLLIIQTEGLLIYLSVSFPYIAHSHAMALHAVPCSASLSGF